MSKKIDKRFIFVLFIVYCVFLAFILFYPNLHHHNTFERSYNLLPLATIYEMISRLVDQSINADIVIKNIGINILLFIPMGMAVPILFQKSNKFWKVTLICFITTALVETIQYIFNLGSFDVDDIILNTVGGICGYGVVNLPFMRNIFCD